MSIEHFAYGDQSFEVDTDLYFFDGSLGPANKKKRFTKTLVKQVEALAEKHGLEVQMCVYSFRFVRITKYRERVLPFLVELAALLGEATGEVQCSFADDDRKDLYDRLFEFFSVSKGRLYRQPGMIIRASKEEVQ